MSLLFVTDDPQRQRNPRPGLMCLLSVLAIACDFDSGSRWVAPTLEESSVCVVGTFRCDSSVQECQDRASPRWVNIEDCAASGRLCAPSLAACTVCLPNGRRCDGIRIETCAEDGSEYLPTESCDAQAGVACRDGRCAHLCSIAATSLSNVGCEYWALDLDNANVGDTLNAAAQQFAVVVSNPQPDITAELTVWQDDTKPGEPGDPREVLTTPVFPLGLEVLRLGARELDGSPDGEFNTGTHSALTRHAYRITSNVPVVAVQFNPLTNVDVFSNDASLLKPLEALGPRTSELSPRYVVLGWPQTIASTGDPDTNFSARNPIDLRSFLSISATRDGTRLRITSTAATAPGAVFPQLIPGEAFEITIDAYDVLNLETDDFNADFSGTLVESTEPIVAFSGSEASDAPTFD